MLSNTNKFLTIFLTHTLDCACEKLCGQRENSAVPTSAGIPKTVFHLPGVRRPSEIYEFMRESVYSLNTQPMSAAGG